VSGPGIPARSEQSHGYRTLTLWCPDWPVMAWRRLHPARADGPVAIVERADRGLVVRSASAEARAEGVRPGLRRREAEARCPGLVVAEADLAGEAVAFEAVARAIEEITPRLELRRPGRLAFPTRGPSRYFGGDRSLAVAVLDAVTATGIPNARAGVADGGFASWLAARRADPGGVCVIEPGTTTEFVAEWPVAALGDPELARLLVRLGLRTLGAFAELSEGAVLARFGPPGVRALRRARGLDDTAPVLTVPPPELAETHEFDPPADRVDVVAFTAKAMADRLLDALADRGLACTRVVIEAETEHDERLARCWRHEGALTPLALATRVHWQLEGWLAHGPFSSETSSSEHGPDDRVTGDWVTGGLTVLRLVPDEVTPATGRQLGFWGGDAAATERAARTLVRVQAMLGPDAVVRAVATGGRTPDERIRWLPWGERDLADEDPAPWPGRVPGPAPARVHVPPLPAALLDADGQAIVVSGRGTASAAPASLRSAAATGAITAFAGPWPHDLRWWDRLTRRRRALWQVVVDDDRGAVACLVSVESGNARVDAVYD